VFTVKASTRPASATYRRSLAGGEARPTGKLMVPVENGELARGVSAPVVWLMEKPSSCAFEESET
jgi:hypothetical protein